MYNTDWIITRLHHPSVWWYIASKITIAAVGLVSRVITGIIFFIDSQQQQQTNQSLECCMETR